MINPQKEIVTQEIAKEIEQSVDVIDTQGSQEKIDFYNAKNSGIIEIQIENSTEVLPINVDVNSDEYRAAKEASMQKNHPDQEKIDYYHELKINAEYAPYEGSRDCVDTDDGATDAYGDGCDG